MLINEHQGGNRSSFSPSSSPFHFFLNDKIILGYPFKTEAQFPRRCQGAANIASRDVLAWNVVFVKPRSCWGEPVEAGRSPGPRPWPLNPRQGLVSIKGVLD